MHSFQRISLAMIAAIGSTGVAATATAAVIELEPESYEVRYNSLLGGTDAFAEDPTFGRLSVRVLDISIAEYYRPILQFDLSSITEPIESASINLYLDSKTDNTQFDVHLRGSNDNRSDTMAYDEFGANNEFLENSYELLHQTSDPFVDRDDEEDQWYSLDITNFLNERYDDYLSGGDSFVFFRLEPQTSYDGSTGIDDIYNFAGYNYSDSVRPYLQVQAIPEPASLVLLGVGGFLALPRRR